jgi:hypothetical protein
MGSGDTTHAERVAIIERHCAGESVQTIATAMQRNYYTIRKLVRAYQHHGWDGLGPRPKGPPRRGRLGTFAPRIKYVLLRLKRQHPGWGVDLLLLAARRRPSLAGLRLPKRSSLAAYLARFGARLLQPHRLPTRRPTPPALTPSAPHQEWQIDFKGDETVNTHHLVVLPFMVCDTFSGAPLAGIIHPTSATGRRDHVTARVVQTDLRQVFTRWGLPDAIRMDRDGLFIGSTRGEWPGVVLLWLVGLGVVPIINRAYHPTDNTIVERNHWTWEQHVVLGQRHASLASVQQATDQDFADRRQILPTRRPNCHAQPFAVAFPTLVQPRRAYSLADEPQLFERARLAAYLSAWEWRRSVDSTGKIALANRNHRIGTAYRGQVVKISFDADEYCLVCRLAGGHEVARLILPELTPEYLMDLDHMPPSEGV